MSRKAWGGTIYWTALPSDNQVQAYYTNLSHPSSRDVHHATVRQDSSFVYQPKCVQALAVGFILIFAFPDSVHLAPATLHTLGTH